MLDYLGLNKSSSSRFCVDEVIDIEATRLRVDLESGGWVLHRIFPLFRESLIEELAPSRINALVQIPTSYLASAFYTGTELPLLVRGRKFYGPRNTEIVDATSGERGFWEAAVKQVSTEKASLAMLNEGDRTMIEGALVGLDQQFGSLLEHVKQIVFYEDEEWAASSQPHFAGAIFLNTILLRTSRLAEIIVHELAHQELFCLNLLDRLVREEADEKFVFAPFQKKERPTLGRLHAAHSLYRTSQFLAGEPEALKDAALLGETLNTFEGEDFTEFGLFLINKCYQPYVTSRSPNEIASGETR